MDDIYLYMIDIPGTVNEMVVPCLDGYTIYIDVSLSYEEKLEAYHHAMTHIQNNDSHSPDPADRIEARCHEKTLQASKRFRSGIQSQRESA